MRQTMQQVHARGHHVMHPRKQCDECRREGWLGSAAMEQQREKDYQTRARIHAIGVEQGYLTSDQAMEAFRAKSAHPMVAEALDRAALAELGDCVPAA